MAHSTFSSVLAAICVASQLLQIELDPISILDLYCRSHEERVEAAAAANTFFTIIRPILPEGVRYKLLDFFGVDGGAATQSDSATPVAPKRGLGQCGHGPNNQGMKELAYGGWRRDATGGEASRLAARYRPIEEWMNSR